MVRLNVISSRQARALANVVCRGRRVPPRVQDMTVTVHMQEGRSLCLAGPGAATDAGIAEFGAAHPQVAVGAASASASGTQA